MAVCHVRPATFCTQLKLRWTASKVMHFVDRMSSTLTAELEVETVIQRARAPIGGVLFPRRLNLVCPQSAAPLLFQARITGTPSPTLGQLPPVSCQSVPNPAERPLSLNSALSVASEALTSHSYKIAKKQSLLCVHPGTRLVWRAPKDLNIFSRSPPSLSTQLTPCLHDALFTALHSPPSSSAPSQPRASREILRAPQVLPTYHTMVLRHSMLSRKRSERTFKLQRKRKQKKTVSF
jgi:hypothetical protein